jgi:hypothetical protein
MRFPGRFPEVASVRSIAVYRVRKLNRRNVVPDGRGHVRRPRLQDFQQAVKRIHRRRRAFTATEISSVRLYNRAVGSPRGASAHIAELAAGTAFGIVVPVSASGCTPSLAETLRVVTAMRLQRTLAELAVAPTVIVLWPAIPAPMDSGQRLVLDRNGQGMPLDLMQVQGRADDLDAALAVLPENDFSPWVRAVMQATFHPNPSVWKMRQMFAFLVKQRAIALPPDAGSRASGTTWDAVNRSAYRVGLARLLEAWPMLALVHPTHGETVSIDVAAGTAFSGEVVPFPTVSATVVEGKVERWLDRYGLKPEELMDSRMQISRLVNRIMPEDPLAQVKAAKEATLSRLFRLEHVMDECGFQASATLDKLAAQLDQQFDHLRHGVVKAEKATREAALSQLTKSRAYLRPGGAMQADGMGLLHYVGFFGPQFPNRLADSVEIGDGRHHLVYVSAEGGTR